MIQIPYLQDSGKLEKAKGIGHVPIINNEFVKKKLQDFHIITQKTVDKISDNLLFDLKNEIEPLTLPEYILSFDGSGSELQIDERFPSTRIGYIQIAAVLVYLTKMLDLEKNPFIDPVQLRQTSTESLFSLVLPGANIREKNCANLQDSWRLDIYQIFNEYVIENQRLLDIFWDLLKYSGFQDLKYQRLFNNNVRLNRCPANETCRNSIDIPVDGIKCPNCQSNIYPTDILRVHEEINPLQSNEGPLHRVMSLLEHINLIGYLRYLVSRRPETLRKMAFIVDGPLALFGPQAWFHRAIFHFINEHIYKTLQTKGIEYPIIIGIEKTGNFAEHAALISERLAPQTLMVLTEEYIYNYILSAKPPQSGIYGAETYYGQKLFYKTKTHQMLTLTIPLLKKEKLSTNVLKHPALLRTLKLLDHIGTRLYQDAVIPVALAHSFASIPLRIGSKVLKLLTEEFIDVD